MSNTNVIPFPGISKPAPTFDAYRCAALVSNALAFMTEDSVEDLIAVALIVERMGHVVARLPEPCPEGLVLQWRPR